MMALVVEWIQQKMTWTWVLCCKSMTCKPCLLEYLTLFLYRELSSFFHGILAALNEVERAVRIVYMEFGAEEF